MALEWGPLLLVTVAAFFAGSINALAGGGSFITLSALVFVGVPPVPANATGTAALLPGYIASAWSDRNLIRAPAGLSLRAVLLLATGGGAAGAVLLLATTDAAFRGIVPWLLLFATLLFAFGPALQRRLPRGEGAGGVGCCAS
ncbi:putative permease [Thioalkalivibrio nitratireducens DSM 14787]|uniref:Probable membrane transporter protein n=1 Tax=Thioalkalivibrio nitratireducens (strain DSM 14787 / UNIQEM 213 / ALEN2) TaxID=1255043 RepID=L0DU73_THIND|nr:putative permease [Thioalkalivibrio nitratireducens DSM 14787]